MMNARALPAWPLAARAQRRERMRRIAWLGAGRADEPSPYLESLRAGLAELGWSEGRNLTIGVFWATGVRSWIDAQPEGTGGWLVALRHPMMRTVLGKMHASPAHEWTVAELAAEARVSRSSLSALFRRLVGVSPMAYLARWRLLLAARILRDEGLSIREAADRVGYEADAAFSRAFKRHFGVAPGKYRERAPPCISVRPSRSACILRQRADPFVRVT